MSYQEFVSKLEKAGIEYTLFRIDTAIYVDVGRFGYRFDDQGKLAGGWVRDCGRGK